MSGRIERRLSELGLVLPEPPHPVATFVPCILSGDLLFLSGQIPTGGETGRHCGRVGKEVSVEDATAAARTCALALLAQAKRFLGTLDRVQRICLVQGFVNADSAFADHSNVVNGASNLFVEVFGMNVGSHARFAVGASSLPFNACVEVAAIMRVS